MESYSYGEDVWGYALSYAQDPIEPNLQFLGTEFGLYVSVDGSKTWTKWKMVFQRFLQWI
ncbi:MAG: hypothetical protein CM1200mP1_06910 [Candidatus Neomarinimicrobiota bacterium]|nr:MAG: hypothetical protein CM1200mP1_06910 [Candidatus Neomarinimicrobiota bacterium]